METDKETWILYRTTNVCNSKIYVGVHQLKNTSYSKNYVGSGDNIKAAIKKYGRENFIRVTLAEFSCIDDAYSAEAIVVNQEFVKRTDTYNISLGGRGGVNLTEEMKNKLRIANTGKKLSPETREKMSKSRKGKVCTKETREKMTIAQTGRLVSEETRAKISAKTKGKVISEETKNKYRNNMMGNKRRLGTFHSEETKAKMSQTKKGKQYCLGNILSEQHKKNLAATSPRNVAVIVNKKYYRSKTVAALAESIPLKTMCYRISSANPSFAEYRVATDEEKAAYALGEVQ
jgi:hypothetical protein